MKKSADELNAQFKSLIDSQSEDAIASFLEDLNDSVADVENAVERVEYERVIAERDAALDSASSYRTRYINRFYEPRNDERQQDYIMSDVLQSKIEDDEEAIGYESLYE